MSQLLRLSSSTLRLNCNILLTRDLNRKILQEEFGCMKCRLHRQWSGAKSNYFFSSRSHSNNAAEDQIPYIFGRNRNFKWKWKRKKKEAKKKEEMLMELADALKTRMAQLEASEIKANGTQNVKSVSISPSAQISYDFSQNETKQGLDNVGELSEGQSEILSMPIELTNENPIQIDSSVIKSLTSVVKDTKNSKKSDPGKECKASLISQLNKVPDHDKASLLDTKDLRYRNTLRIDMEKFAFPSDKSVVTPLEAEKLTLDDEGTIGYPEIDSNSLSTKSSAELNSFVVQRAASPETVTAGNSIKSFSTDSGFLHQDSGSSLASVDFDYDLQEEEKLQMENQPDWKFFYQSLGKTVTAKDALTLPDDSVSDELSADKMRNLGWLDVSGTETADKKTELSREYSSRQIDSMRQNFNQDFKSYIEVCIFSGQLSKAHSQLRLHHLNSKNVGGVDYQIQKITDVEIYNVLLHAWAKEGNMNMVGEVMTFMKADELSPNMQTFAACLECLGRRPDFSTEAAEALLSDMEEEGFDIRNIFREAVLVGDEVDYVEKTLMMLNVKADTDPGPGGYHSNLLEQLNEPLISWKVTKNNPFAGIFDKDTIYQKTGQQLVNEKKMLVNIPSVCANKDPSPLVKERREMLKGLRDQWEMDLMSQFNKKFHAVQTKTRANFGMTVGPYLNLFGRKEYVNIMMMELEAIYQCPEYFSPSTKFLKMRLGERVYKRYLMRLKKANMTERKILNVYEEYAHRHNKTHFRFHSYGHCWRSLCSSVEGRLHLEEREQVWSNHVLKLVGQTLFDVIMKATKVNTNMFRSNRENIKLVPAFYLLFRNQGRKIREEIKPHPLLARLVRETEEDNLTFDTTDLPMLVPPIPWTSAKSGGYIVTPSDLIRLNGSENRTQFLKKISGDQILPVLDSLNNQSQCPWVVNEKMLDIIISIFKNNGSKELDISPPASSLPPIPKHPDRKLSQKEKSRLLKERNQIEKSRREAHSLWSSELYRLSIANALRKQVFWFPHNLDFRGRTYPCPPHLNHLGGDVTRSILLFAKGKPLGEEGLDWLKIHLINLTGLKKRSSNKERLAFANEMMPEIMDSADNPLDGNKWWQSSDEPWQTLACCMEIAQAVRSPDPTQYLSNFPTHQDGSCNGLQHYAALGRDQAGAESVNLCQFDAPKDVYSDVVELVEELRKSEAEKGEEIAKVLEGFVRRKVIKQTIMTTVYGVTMYGSKLQILRQLEDIPEFPQDQVRKASVYLADKTFLCLQKMFSSAREIQDWLTVVSHMIARDCGMPIQWTTPLGLPVLQPYYKEWKESTSKKAIGNDRNNRIPNFMKQKNGFPPNFIHSLDATHMMLTSLHCWKAGITFASVHDCFWTHACDVKIMNEVCREQFVALHKQPILENLSLELLQTVDDYRNGKEKISKKEEKKLEILESVITHVPIRGTFDLDSVLDSTYFFS